MIPEAISPAAAFALTITVAALAFFLGLLAMWAWVALREHREAAARRRLAEAEWEDLW